MPVENIKFEDWMAGQKWGFWYYWYSITWYWPWRVRYWLMDRLGNNAHTSE